MKKDDVIYNNPPEEPESFDKAVGKFIEKLAQWSKLYDGDVQSVSEGYFVSANDLLNDLVIFADDVYDGTYERDEKSLRVKFSNGQIFRISVEEESTSID